MRVSTLKQSFLILAFLVVSMIGLLYGISPAWFARTYLGVNELSVNFAHILRAVMCLYLALGLFWLCAAFSDRYRNAAVLTTIVFAGGLVIGRVVSFIADGRPSPLLIFYAVAEIALIPLAYWIFRRPD
jgi:hypothetical protein